MARNDIPYKIYQGLSFYGRREVKDVLAYLRLAINPHDDESLVRVINYPTRGIGQTTMDKIRVAAADNDVSIWTVLENIADFGLPIQSGAVQKITEFVYMIKRFEAEVPTTDAFTLAKQIVYASGIVKALREEDDPESAERIDNIDELLNGVQEFCEEEESEYSENSDNSENSEKKLRTLDEFLQQVLLYTSEDKDKDKDADKVSLMTIHAAKGLEFPYVFVVGMEEQIFPSFLAMSRPELEEERHGRRGEPLHRRDRPPIHRDAGYATQHARAGHPAAGFLQCRETQSEYSEYSEYSDYSEAPDSGCPQQPRCHQQHHARYARESREVRHRQGAGNRGRRRLAQGHSLLRGRRTETADAQVRQTHHSGIVFACVHSGYMLCCCWLRCSRRGGRRWSSRTRAASMPTPSA